MTPRNTATLGLRGEEAAARYLSEHGYHVLHRRFRYGKKEIDIIARTKDLLVFVEVKARSFSPVNFRRFGRPCLSVNTEKRRCLRQAATAYLRSLDRPLRVRFDVIEVYFEQDPPHDLLSLHHMPDAFRAE